MHLAARLASLAPLVWACLGAPQALAAAGDAEPRPRAVTARTLVVCAPGYPGTTAEAQPTMDAFASAAAEAAGFKPGSLAAVYHETLKGGVERLGAADAVLALVTLPFYLEERARLRLTPRLQVSIEPGGAETWS